MEQDAKLGVMAASFAFQETAILPVLPTIQRQLPGATTTTGALLESAFLIVAAVSAPLIGKFGDAHGTGCGTRVGLHHSECGCSWWGPALA